MAMRTRKSSGAVGDRATPAMTLKEAERRQSAYAVHRRAWAEAVGRPYRGDEDPRPPPGEVDAGPDE
jgi:hypothetical protein